MRISYTVAKDEKTKRERGFSLAIGEEVIRRRVHTVVDTRRDYGELRYVAFGYVGDRLHVCVFTIRSEVYHLISVRKANDREQRKFGR